MLVWMTGVWRPKRLNSEFDCRGRNLQISDALLKSEQSECTSFGEDFFFSLDRQETGELHGISFAGNDATHSRQKITQNYFSRNQSNPELRIENTSGQV